MQQMTGKLEEVDEEMIVDRNLDTEGKYGHLNGKTQEKIDQVKKVVDKWRALFGTAKPSTCEEINKISQGRTAPYVKAIPVDRSGQGRWCRFSDNEAEYEGMRRPPGF
jgi:uncharacterized protein YjbJ (UPF0337 family)